MNWRPLADWAFTEADRMAVESSMARQLGFKALAAHLSEQSAGARAWANECYRNERASCPMVFPVQR